MTTVDVVYGGGPDHQPCLITLDGVAYDPADLAQLGREVIALERDLAEERQRVADLEQRVQALERALVIADAALRTMAPYTAEQMQVSTLREATETTPLAELWEDMCRRAAACDAAEFRAERAEAALEALRERMGVLEAAAGVEGT